MSEDDPGSELDVGLELVDAVRAWLIEPTDSTLLALDRLIPRIDDPPGPRPKYHVLRTPGVRFPMNDAEWAFYAAARDQALALYPEITEALVRRGRLLPDWLHELPPWVPSHTREYLRDPDAVVRDAEEHLWSLGAEAKPLYENLRALTLSQFMGPYWRGAPGRAMAKRSVELVRLAQAIESAMSGEKGELGSVGGAPGWHMEPRRKREAQARRISTLAAKLRKELADTHFDLPVYRLMSMGKVQLTPEEEARPEWQGPLASRALAGLERYAQHVEAMSETEPVFNAGENQKVNYLMAVVFRFHIKWLDLAEDEAIRAAAAVASAVFDDLYDEGQALNATRAVRTPVTFRSVLSK